MFCKNCGDKLGPADRFCGSCGTPKVELCPTCGQVWDKEIAEDAPTPSVKALSKEKNVIKETTSKPSTPPVEVVSPPTTPQPKVQPNIALLSQISTARVQPVYGKQYELGKDCPNCGEKGQKGKKCSTCKGTF
jgi:predicted amidophosphoribosyltransferase